MSRTRYLLITRHPAECGRMQKLLEPHGWAVRAYPVLRVEDVFDPEGWRGAISMLDDWGDSLWLAMASPRAPARMAQQAGERGAERLLAAPIAVVGDATAVAAARAKLHVELVGPGTAAGLARDLLPLLDLDAPVVFACGKDHRPELPETLEAAGHRVQPLVVYAMRPTPPRELPPPGPDLAAVLLTSPRSARLYLDGMGGHPLPLPHWALGPTTRQAAAAAGIDCRIPETPDFESLVEELCRM